MDVRALPAPAPVDTLPAEGLTLDALKEAATKGIVLGNKLTRELVQDHFDGCMRRLKVMILECCKRRNQADLRNIRFRHDGRPLIFRFEVVGSGPDAGKLRFTLWGAVVRSTP